jgi:hypothetical protein
MASRPSSVQLARQEIARYLRAQSVPLQTAVDAQKKWAAPVQQLFDQVKLGKVQVASVNARVIGRQYGPLFKKALEQAQNLETPQPAVRCQEYFLRWLRSLVNAADAFAHAPEDGRDGSYLRDATDYLDDARYALKPMNELRQRLYEAAQGKSSAPAKPT